MTDNQKKYEEAARKSLSRLLNDHEDADYETGFVNGASFAEKEAHNAAIDKVFSIVNENEGHRFCTRLDVIGFLGLLEKLKL